MIPVDSKCLTMSRFYLPTTISELSVVSLRERRPRGKVELVYIVPKPPICRY